jgi:ribosomal protein S18 acetylase RimI-like enzyme
VPIEIRSATADDASAVLALWRSAGSPEGVTDTREGVALLLARDPHALLVAESDGAVIGSLIATFDGWRGHFYRLAVHPRHRRQGVATALLGEGERRLLARGARRLSAIVGGERAPAVAFWRARGYSLRDGDVRFIRHP